MRDPLHEAPQHVFYSDELKESLDDFFAMFELPCIDNAWFTDRIFNKKGKFEPNFSVTCFPNSDSGLAEM